MDMTERAAMGRWQQDKGGLIRGAASEGRRRAGFTMLEVVVAMAVLLVATAAAFGSQIASFGVIHSSRDRSVAMTDLEVAMEELLAVGANQMVDDFEGALPMLAFSGLHLREQLITPTYPGYAGVGPLPDPIDIMLTATWLDSRGRPQRLQLSTQTAL